MDDDGNSVKVSHKPLFLMSTYSNAYAKVKIRIFDVRLPGKRLPYFTHTIFQPLPYFTRNQRQIIEFIIENVANDIRP